MREDSTIQTPNLWGRNYQSLWANGRPDGAAPIVLSEEYSRPSVNEKRVVTGIVLIKLTGLRWFHAPKEYHPAKTLYIRCKMVGHGRLRPND